MTATLTATMPAVTLPSIPLADVQSHTSNKSCYVTRGTKVYDITPFVDDHPGGGELILEYGGKDVSEIMGDEISHTHSEAAYEILDEHLIGFLPTESVINTATKSGHPDEILPLPPTANGQKELKANGVSKADSLVGTPGYLTGKTSAEELSDPTDPTSDYKTHKFLDLSKPLLMQVWFGGFAKDFYLEQVHRPRHYKGGESAPLFGNFLEPLSKTAWWVVPIVWLPPVAYGTYEASLGLPNIFVLAALFTVGLGIWTIVEYTLHRCLFHLD